MGDVTAYLYGSLKNYIHMKIPKGFYLLNKTNSKEGYSIKLNKPFYWLKQSGHVWHNSLIDYLFKEGYRYDPICSCIYMKRSKNEFSIIIDYVDDINIIGTTNELTKAIDCLKKEFEMKDLEKEKILFEITNWAFKQRCFNTSRDLYN